MAISDDSITSQMNNDLFRFLERLNIKINKTNSLSVNYNKGALKVNTIDITYKKSGLDEFIIVNSSNSELAIKLNINMDFEQNHISSNEVFISQYTK